MATRMYVCESAEHPSSLLLGLNEQRLKGALCDITIRVQGHLFKAHINVLASAMGYFRDLFCKPTKEKTEGIIDIPMIVNSTGFSKILDFVYTSQLCLSQSTVMQVMCSACYLQIPYVVEKCQEFISTHGHVPQQVPSLQALGGHLATSSPANPGQQSQQRSYSKQTTAQQNASASASLTLLSQLNRASDLSRARAIELAKQEKTSPEGQQQQQQTEDVANSDGLLDMTKQDKMSPRMQQDHDEQQECELINTPPSPGGRSNGEDRIASGSPDTDDSGRTKDSSKQIMVKQEYGMGNNDDYISDMNRDAGDGRDLQESIDHSSLAAYFREKDHWTESDRNPTTYYAMVDPQGVLANNGERHDSPRGLSDYPPSSLMIQSKKEKPKKEYRCEYCSKLFGRQQHLKRHILTHTGERPYPCQYCDKRFRRSEHLKHHLVSHENMVGFVSPPVRKRMKRDREDAVSLSKLMIDQYGQMHDADRHLNGPVVLPSMYSDITDRQSPSDKNGLFNSSNGHYQANGDAMDDRSNSPGESALMTALNLSRAPKGQDDASPQNLSRDSDEKHDNSGGGNSPKSESNSVCFDENPGIIGMEGSEVLTSDLKRLIAAMDE